MDGYGTIDNQPPVASFNLDGSVPCEATVTATSTDPNGQEDISKHVWYRNDKEIANGASATIPVKDYDIIKLVTMDKRIAESRSVTKSIPQGSCQ